MSKRVDDALAQFEEELNAQEAAILAAAESWVDAEKAESGGLQKGGYNPNALRPRHYKLPRTMVFYHTTISEPEDILSQGLLPASQTEHLSLDVMVDSPIDGVFLSNGAQARVMRDQITDAGEGETPVYTFSVTVPKGTVVYTDEMMPESAIIVEGRIPPEWMHLVEEHNAIPDDMTDFSTEFKWKPSKQEPGRSSDAKPTKGLGAAAGSTLRKITAIPLKLSIQADVPLSEYDQYDLEECADQLTGWLGYRVVVSQSGIIFRGNDLSGASVGHIQIRRGRPVAMIAEKYLPSTLDSAELPAVEPRPEVPSNEDPDNEGRVYLAARAWLAKASGKAYFYGQYPESRLTPEKLHYTTSSALVDLSSGAVHVGPRWVNWDDPQDTVREETVTHHHGLGMAAEEEHNLNRNNALEIYFAGNNERYPEKTNVIEINGHHTSPEPMTAAEIIKAVRALRFAGLTRPDTKVNVRQLGIKAAPLDRLAELVAQALSKKTAQAWMHKLRNNSVRTPSERGWVSTADYLAEKPAWFQAAFRRYNWQGRSGLEAQNFLGKTFRQVVTFLMAQDISPDERTPRGKPIGQVVTEWGIGVITPEEFAQQGGSTIGREGWSMLWRGDGPNKADKMAKAETIDPAAALTAAAKAGDSNKTQTLIGLMGAAGGQYQHLIPQLQQLWKEGDYANIIRLVAPLVGLAVIAAPALGVEIPAGLAAAGALLPAAAAYLGAAPARMRKAAELAAQGWFSDRHAKTWYRHYGEELYAIIGRVEQADGFTWKASLYYQGLVVAKSPVSEELDEVKSWADQAAQQYLKKAAGPLVLRGVEELHKLHTEDFLQDANLADAVGFAPLVLAQDGTLELRPADGGLDVILKWDDGSVRSTHALTWAKGLDVAKVAGKYMIAKADPADDSDWEGGDGPVGGAKPNGEKMLSELPVNQQRKVKECLEHVKEMAAGWEHSLKYDITRRPRSSMSVALPYNNLSDVAEETLSRQVQSELGYECEVIDHNSGGRPTTAVLLRRNAQA